MSAREITACAVCAAMLIAVQAVLSAVVGVELVTLLFCAFCAAFGVKCGVVTGVGFSLLRCIIFGFFPSVVVLYLVYYPIFAVAFGFYGRLTEGVFSKKCPKSHKNARILGVCVGAAALAVALTVSFTLMDDVISPLMLGMNRALMKRYFYASLPAMATGAVCSAVTVGFGFAPLYAVLSRLGRLRDKNA